jgi:hypothetical protein
MGKPKTLHPSRLTSFDSPPGVNRTFERAFEMEPLKHDKAMLRSSGQIQPTKDIYLGKRLSFNNGGTKVVDANENGHINSVQRRLMFCNSNTNLDDDDNKANILSQPTSMAGLSSQTQITKIALRGRCFNPQVFQKDAITVITHACHEKNRDFAKVIIKDGRVLIGVNTSNALDNQRSSSTLIDITSSVKVINK